MCGIAGFSGNFSPDLLDRMIGRIAHRGPDDSGRSYVPEKGIGLGHTRLSIIDLSPLGHQPMWDLTESAAIVFNGEIYNYRELRDRLASDGYRFRSKSDTEVLLNLYLRHGEAMLPKLNGIFAFAIWDKKQDLLFLARDGLGVKPLYYAETPKGFLFASEIKALLAEAGVERSLDPLAIGYYLTYLWSPEPFTVLKSVRKLESGNSMIVRNGKIRGHKRFYDLPYDRPTADISPRDAVVQVREATRRAVERQMIADVPVGAFLSGGLDSSMVAALAKDYVTNGRLQCFTIGFSDSAWAAEGMVDDLPYAKSVAEHLGVDLHTICVGPEMANHLEAMIYHLDEPQGDPAPLNVLFISKLAREHGIKVLLSGAGGDDIFSGYRRHLALWRERYWNWMPQPLKKGLRNLTQRLPLLTASSRRIAKAFQYAHLEGDERLVSYFNWIDPSISSSLAGPLLKEGLQGSDLSSPLIESLSRLPKDTPSLNRMLYLEAKHFLADHNLNYTDKMSMAAGVEVRVPLLDLDLIALAASLPTGFKQNGTSGKWIFKKAAEPYLPYAVIERPKTGFGAPIRRWLRVELKSMVDDVLSESSLATRGIFDPKRVRELVQMDRLGKIDAAYTIFTIICTEIWCRIFLDRGGK
jgi:asparagine synthase (glutamine-hydrolysing)